MRRVAAWFALVVGITLIGFTFGEHLVSRSHDARKIADYYQPLMSEKGLADLSAGFDAVKAAGAQLDTQAEPRLQRALGMSDTAFAAYVALIGTHSDHIVLEDGKRHALLAAVADAIDAAGGTLTVPYTTHLSLARAV